MEQIDELLRNLKCAIYFTCTFLHSFGVRKSSMWWVLTHALFSVFPHIYTYYNNKIYSVLMRHVSWQKNVLVLTSCVQISTAVRFWLILDVRWIFSLSRPICYSNATFCMCVCLHCTFASVSLSLSLTRLRLIFNIRDLIRWVRVIVARTSWHITQQKFKLDAM